jgi:SNF family Na+-dependent transporter
MEENRKLGEKQLSLMKKEQTILQDKWKLQRDKITFGICVFILLVSIGVNSYVLMNAASFPVGVIMSVTGIIYLVTFACIGYITNTPSILRAVASAIITFSTKQKNKDD